MGRPRTPRPRSGRLAVLWRAAACRRGAGAGGRAVDAAARRAGLRHERLRNPRLRAAGPQHPRSRRHHPAGRARHADGDERLRPHRRAQLRPDHRRGLAGGDPERSSRDRGLSRAGGERVLEIRDMVCGYGGVTALRGISLRGQGRAARRPDRRQRRRQEHDAARDLRARCAAFGLDAVRGQGHRRRQAAARGGLGHRALSGGTAGIPAHDGRGESRHGRLSAQQTPRRSRPTAIGSMPSFRALPSGESRRPAPCRAASSRCWRSAGR